MLIGLSQVWLSLTSVTAEKLKVLFLANAENLFKSAAKFGDQWEIINILAWLMFCLPPLNRVFCDNFSSRQFPCSYFESLVIANQRFCIFCLFFPPTSRLAGHSLAVLDIIQLLLESFLSCSLNNFGLLLVTALKKTRNLKLSKAAEKNKDFLS